MKRFTKITPEGSKDLLFEESRIRRDITSKLHNLFTAENFKQVMTPHFEFYDVFTKAEAYYPQESMYMSLDKRGRVLVARPDSTIPIARLICSRLKDHPKPLKLYYEQAVFRNNPELKGKNNEILQMGVEHVGENNLNSDISILALSIKALDLFKFDNMRLEIGHVGIFKLLMEDLNVDRDTEESIHQFISTKNYAALSAKLDKLDKSDAANILKELPKLFGGAEVFEKALRVFKDYDKRLEDMLNRIRNIYEGLNELELSENIIVDFGLVNQADYYSSLVFKGHVLKSKEAVLSGGRYDNLLKNFGCDFPATGFALNIDAIADGILEEEKIMTSSPRNNSLKIALTKGRLEKQAIKLLENMGFDCKALHNKGRKLTVPIGDSGVEAVIGKAADVLTYVEHGVCDMGIVGLDTVMEYGGSFYEVLDLGFGNCKMVLAAPKGKDFYEGYSKKKIATKYPNIAKEFFKEKGMDVQIIKIEGSVELAPLLKLTDGIVDLVETGTTLKANGLEIVEDIRKISARLIVNETGMKIKRKEIEKFVNRIGGQL